MVTLTKDIQFAKLHESNNGEEAFYLDLYLPEELACLNDRLDSLRDNNSAVYGVNGVCLKTGARQIEIDDSALDTQFIHRCREGNEIYGDHYTTKDACNQLNGCANKHNGDGCNGLYSGENADVASIHELDNDDGDGCNESCSNLDHVNLLQASPTEIDRSGTESDSKSSAKVTCTSCCCEWNDTCSRVEGTSCTRKGCDWAGLRRRNVIGLATSRECFNELVDAKDDTGKTAYGIETHHDQLTCIRRIHTDVKDDTGNTSYGMEHHRGQLPITRRTHTDVKDKTPYSYGMEHDHDQLPCTRKTHAATVNEGEQVGRCRMDRRSKVQAQSTSAGVPVTPFVVFVHGGGWRRGARDAWKHYLYFDVNFLVSFLQYLVGTYGNIGDTLAANGIACAVISYPLTEARLPVLLFEMAMSYIQCCFFMLISCIPVLSVTLLVRSFMVGPTTNSSWETMFHEQADIGHVKVATLFIMLLTNICTLVIIALHRQQFKVDRIRTVQAFAFSLIATAMFTSTTHQSVLRQLVFMTLLTFIINQCVILRLRMSRRHRKYHQQLAVVKSAIHWARRFCNETGLSGNSCNDTGLSDNGCNEAGLSVNICGETGLSDNGCSGTGLAGKGCSETGLTGKGYSETGLSGNGCNETGLPGKGSPELYLMGHSAGGHLSTLAALDEAVQGRDVAIKGVISLSGVYDLLCLKDGFLKLAYLQPTFGNKLATWLTASPTHIAEKLTYGSVKTKFLLMSAEKDLFLKQQSMDFHGVLESKGVNSEHVEINRTNHFTIVTNTRTDIGSPLGHAIDFIRS